MGCNPSSTPQEGVAVSTSGERSTATQAKGHVSRSGFERKGLDWPLTVAEGYLGCTKLSRWVKVGGVKYGLNGSSSERGFKEIEPIWQIDQEMADNLEALGAPNDPPIRVNIGDMISEAGKYC